ncbi:hypothetical protein M378DRAFT_126372 [Amanita muscaria Koide BX008]|uniref:Uncharacterized protein n=1 Tax=Amanita muscaria (strain Koide BX008) TaxID=946122 RepID=A0A0C2TCM5_AMAMK|nr:hypothetical protein M378DRAFT_126372 [Amanita muscaria Koide BX008]
MAKFEDLNHDLLVNILDIFRDDYGALYNCSLVCKQFNILTSRLLYRRVVLSPPFSPVLNLRDRGTLTEPSQFTSACLPKYASLVEELRISGFLSPRPPPLNVFSTTLFNAVRAAFCRLRVVELTPNTYHEDVFTQTLQALGDTSTLRDLAVNSSCTDAPRAPLITRIGHLERLELWDPTRAMLELLPEWLQRLSSETLTELHIKGNCGSITPGVLTGFISSPLQHRLRALSLGLSYSLTHDHVFTFLGSFPQLEELELRYYWQLKEPTVRLTLSQLRKFTVLYAGTQAKREVLGLCKWMRKVVSSSPLEDLTVICDDGNNDDGNTGPNISFDSIVDHLSKKHAKTLRFLDLRSSYVGTTALKALLSTCLNVEVIYVSASKDALTIFEQLYGQLMNLRMAGFKVRNVKRNKYKFDRDRVRNLMMAGPPAFRKLIVNGTVWKGSWTTEPDGNVVFSVEIYRPNKLPWERE